MVVVHLGQMTDAVTPYLRSVLGLMGIHEVDFVLLLKVFDIAALKADALKDAHLKAQQMAV